MIGLEKLAAYRLVYLATPYSRYKGGIHIAFVDCAVFAAGLIRHGVSVYSPICHTHPIAIYGCIDPLDHSFWIKFDEAMMHACDALVVAEMPGWETSKGILHEIDFFNRAGKDIHYLPADIFKDASS